MAKHNDICHPDDAVMIKFRVDEKLAILHIISTIPNEVTTEFELKTPKPCFPHHPIITELMDLSPAVTLIQNFRTSN